MGGLGGGGGHVWELCVVVFGVLCFAARGLGLDVVPFAD